MKILFIGDINANTGPSNVNKLLTKKLPSNTIFVKSKWAVLNIIKIFFSVFMVDAVVMSGLSKLNIFACKWGKLLKKKTLYIMHGCVEHENSINRINDEITVRLERTNLALVDKILCVSENFSKWMIKNYPQHADKVTFLNNGVNWELQNEVLFNEDNLEREPYRVMTIGGGIPRKNVISICKAVALANKELGNKIRLTVLGRDEKDTEEIKKFEFVDYFGKLPHQETIKLYKRANLFIQNSVFETFGLAPLEALMCGCSILVSKNVGSLSVMNNLTEYDVIEDCFDIVEIKKKILYLLENSNNKRIIESIDRNRTSYASAAKNLIDIISSMNE